MTPLPFTIQPIATVPPAAIEALLDRAFGDDRHGRTAYRIRDGMAAIAALSFVAVDRAGGGVIGSVQCWPVALHLDRGGAVPLVMLGPVAVDPARQGGGIGRRLTESAIAAHDARGGAAMMLIGDPGYYGRFFGFSAEATGGWRAPGPVERHRLLARGLALPAETGRLGPRDGADI